MSGPATINDGQSSSTPLPVVRRAVRDLLLASVSFQQLDLARKREVAEAMVRVCQTAVSLLREEIESDALAREAATAWQMAAAPDRSMETRRPSAVVPLATAQNAGTEFSGVSAQRVAGTTRDILNAVSFPRFVTELINGVFKALVDSNQQQMHGYVDLIKNVAASTEGFSDLNLGPDRARQWLAEQFPGSFQMQGGPDEDTDPRDREEEQAEARLGLREGGSPPSEEALRTSLGLAPDETVPTGDPETVLVPLARRALARQRQQMLATMVMLGMQRIVIESGRLNASMRFHIDTRSAASTDAGSKFDFENKFEAKGKFGAGPWGVEAKMTNTIGYVSTQRQQTTEEMNTDLDLNSSVELYFKTDYLPLEMMAGKGQVDRIKVNTLNPDAEAAGIREERKARMASARQDDAQRRTSLGDLLAPRRTEPLAPAPRQPARPATNANRDGQGGGRTPPRGGNTRQNTDAPSERERTGQPEDSRTSQPAEREGGPRPAPPARRGQSPPPESRGEAAEPTT